MVRRNTTTPIFGAAAYVALGLGALLLAAPAMAQGPAATAEADRSTAQPPEPPTEIDYLCLPPRLEHRPRRLMTFDEAATAFALSGACGPG